MYRRRELQIWVSKGLASKGLLEQHTQNGVQQILFFLFIFLFWLFLGCFYTSSPSHLLCTHVHISMYVFAVVFLKGLRGFKYRMGLRDWECYLFPGIFPTFHWTALLVPSFTSDFKCIRNTNKYCCNFILFIQKIPLIVKQGAEDHLICTAVIKICLYEKLA